MVENSKQETGNCGLITGYYIYTTNILWSQMVWYYDWICTQLGDAARWHSWVTVTWAMNWRSLTQEASLNHACWECNVHFKTGRQSYYRGGFKLGWFGCRKELSHSSSTITKMLTAHTNSPFPGIGGNTFPGIDKFRVCHGARCL